MTTIDIDAEIAATTRQLERMDPQFVTLLAPALLERLRLLEERRDRDAQSDGQTD